jgi:hypothetical protein
MDNFAYLAASGLCIGAIACLSGQKTARLGNTLGLMGVGTGIATTLGSMGADPAVYGQVLGESPVPYLLFTAEENSIPHLRMLSWRRDLDVFQAVGD